MEFGRVDIEELEKIDFTLPQDRPETARVLSLGTSKPTKVYMGCAKWGRKDWVGKIYPEKTKEADFLNHYGRHFNSIELNATFYRMPRQAQAASWRSKVGPDFQFCPKFSQMITHIKRLKDVKPYVDRFLEGVSGFGDALGPIFLMPHPTFGPKNIEVLENFIKELPEDIKIFVELRHEDWYADATIFNRVFAMLQETKAGAVITDAAGRRDCVHMRLTTPSAFIRFVGNSLHPTDYTRIDSWVQRIKQWMGQGMETVYFFMHQHEELYSPELARYAIQELNKHCGTQIPEPMFVSKVEHLPEPSAKKETKTRKPPARKAAVTKK